MDSIRFLSIAIVGIFFSFCTTINDGVFMEEKSFHQDVHTTTTFLQNEYLTEAEAAFVATYFTNGNAIISKSAHSKEIDNVFPLLEDNGLVLAFAVNFKGGGYNVISGTQKYSPIIAYSESGHISPTFQYDNSGFTFWMNNIIRNDIQQRIKDYSDTDSLARINQAQWQGYSKIATQSPASTYSYSLSMSHIYWYGQERTRLMNKNFTDAARMMSQDLHRYNSLVAASYAIGNKLSDSEISNYMAQNSLLKHNYEMAGMSSSNVSSYFWTEYGEKFVRFDTGELISTRWHQFEPYNNLNPDKTDGSGEKQPAGCVTIAVAQIMNYHRFPQLLKRKEGLSSYTMDIDWNKTNVNELEPNSTNTEIPKFIHFVNLGVKTDNGDDGSGSTIKKAQKFFELNDYTAEIYEFLDLNVLERELRAGRPVYVRGFDKNGGGHAFICCGYRDNARKVVLELKSTNSLEAADYNYNPYYTVKNIEGREIANDSEYFCFNWGWEPDGRNPWIIKPVYGGVGPYTEDVKLLTVAK